MATEQHARTSLTLLFSASCAVVVACMYLIQPLIGSVAQALGSSRSATSLVIAVTSAGYAVGLFLLVPLGDILDRRIMIPAMMVVTAVMLLIVGETSSLTEAEIGGFLLGLSCVSAQTIVPFSTTFASEAEVPKVISTVMSGLLLGILFARTASGVLAGLFGWRRVYDVFAVLVLILAVLILRRVPSGTAQRSTRQSYAALLRSSFTLAKSSRTLQVRSALGAVDFGIFMGFWATSALLLERSPYRYDAATIGLFGLAGAGGLLGSNLVGRLTRRRIGPYLTPMLATVTVVGFLIITLFHGHLLPLIAGIIILDFGVQGVHISNQNVIYRIDPGSRSRINSIYMTSNFIGGAVLSAVSTTIFSKYGFGWVGVICCVLAAAMVPIWFYGRKAEAITP